jgi:tripartite-type tricarboxylate transporter receptor subunit TctC
MRDLFLAFLACVVTTISAPLAAQAPTYPSKPIRIVVPYAAGGYADAFARLVATGLARAMDQPVVVENKPGANGNIACEYVARAAPDGYTLVMGGVNTHAVNVSLFRTMPFDPVRDFTPVSFVVSPNTLIVVNPSLGVATVGELVALAQSRPGLLTYSSGGTGTFTHLAVESLKSRANVDMTHVPYKGEGESLLALLRGEVSMAALSVPTALPHVRSGKLRPIAIAGTARSTAFPDLPTVAETLPGAGANSWIGLFAPAMLAPEIARRLNQEVGRIMASPELRERLAATDSTFVAMTPAQFAAFQKSEIASWAEVIRANNIRVD